MPMLEIKNLSVVVDSRQILNGLNLTVNAGEVHAIMGPNGAGKSTLAHVLSGKAGYEVTGGEVLFEGNDLLALAADERAAKGVFLAFQYPLEIPGVATMTFLRTAMNAQRKKRGEPELSTPDFMKRVRDGAAKLGIAAGHAAPAGQRRIFRRREEAQRSVADGAAGAEAVRARRNRFRPRHRRAEGRRRRRQSSALAGTRALSSSRIISGCSTTSCRTSCMCCRRAAS